MSFAWPLGLLALLVVPIALAGFLLAQRRPSRYPVTFTNIDVLAGVVDRSTAWRRYVPPALFLAALAALALGLSRPTLSVTGEREQGTVILTIDSSGSMLAEDVEPTRLAAAQAAVRTFLDRLPGRYQVGLITFAGEPQVVAPVTSDRELVRSALDYLVPLRRTAIGDALARSVELARPAATGTGQATTIALRTTSAAAAAPDPKRSPVAILMLSDGAQTSGELTPLQGAQRARELGIPVYTIALGTPNGVLERDFGGFLRTIPVPPDRETLRQIARVTGGKFFDAPSAEALSAAYEDLGTLLTRGPEQLEATFALLGVGAALLLAAGALSMLWSSRLP